MVKSIEMKRVEVTFFTLVPPFPPDTFKIVALALQYAQRQYLSIL